MDRSSHDVFCGFLYDVVSIPFYIACNGRMTDQLEKISEEAVMAKSIDGPTE